MRNQFFFCLISVLLFLQPARAQTVLPAINDQSNRVLVIYSALDENVSLPLLRAFQAREPDVEIHYHDLQTLEIYTRTIEETDAGGNTADLLISSAMDLQVKLANDGYATSLDGAANNWPKWAVWQDSVFGLTFEPSVIAYNKSFFAGRRVPNNRAELAALLESADDSLFGKIGTYDIERSGLGYLFLARDAEHDRHIWKLVRSMGTAGVKLYSSSSAMLERISDGRLVVGYNILGSYAEDWATKSPDLGIVHPEDFTVVMSRIALVPQAAAEPELGRRALEFLMSTLGQKIMSETLKLPSINPNVEGPNTASAFRKELGARLRPVSIGPGLVAYLDQVKRARFIKRWNQALRGE